MREYSLIILTTLACLTGCLSYQWPTTVRRCYLNQTNSAFDKCLMETAKHTLPLIRNGIKAWGISQLEPFRMLSDMNIDLRRPAINLSFRISNGTCHGPSYFDLQKARYDRKNKEFFFEGLHSNLTLLGNYDVSGQLFAFNLNGRGQFRFEALAVKEAFWARMHPAKKSGYVAPKFKYKIKGMRDFKFWMKDSKLPPIIEEGVINVVNDNWERIVQATLPTMEEGFTSQYRIFLGPLFKRFPYSEIIPEGGDSSAPAAKEEGTLEVAAKEEGTVR